MSIDTLPDDVLLVIFNSFLYESQHIQERAEAWQSLVHVCRRWRSIVFGSPRHLDLQLVCTTRTRTRDTQDVWPALPLIIWYFSSPKGSVDKLDNIIAGLEHRDRVSQIHLINVPSSDLGIILAEMQQPFPKLEILGLESDGETSPVVSDSLLGGSAPSLYILELSRVRFPGLPKLLLSATHLVALILSNIPHAGYFSPDTLATAISTVTSLDYLVIDFQSPRSYPNSATRRPPPSTRYVFPVLTRFSFKGASEYLEDFLALIDAPQLNDLKITLFNDILFDTPQSMQFISRTPTSRVPEKVIITLRDHAAGVNLPSRTPDRGRLHVEILCRGLDWQLSSLEQVCTSFLPSLSALEDLYIHKDSRLQPDRKDDIENRLYLELIRPFTGVKNLYLSEEFSPRIAPAFQESVEGRATAVLPALQNIFLEGFESSEPVQEGLRQFFAARQVAGHPIAISRWMNPE